jgi:acetyl-CoA acetyltransferase
MVARAYMNEFGADERDLGAVALHDRAAAIAHPNSHMRSPMDFAAYCASRMIAHPLRDKVDVSYEDTDGFKTQLHGERRR